MLENNKEKLLIAELVSVNYSRQNNVENFMEKAYIWKNHLVNSKVVLVVSLSISNQNVLYRIKKIDLKI